MKKFSTYFVIIVLILASLACRLPFLNRSAETPVVSSNETVLEEPALQSQTPSAETSANQKVFNSNGVEITLPASFTLGDVEKDLTVLLEGLQALSEGVAQDMQSLYEQNKEDIVFWGYDTASPGEYKTSLVILKNEEFAGMPLSIVSAFANGLLGDAVASLSQEQLALGDREVLRFLSSTENAGVETAQAVYLFNEAGKLWVVGFFTTQSQIDQQLRTFDAAVASINILPVE